MGELITVPGSRREARKQRLAEWIVMHLRKVVVLIMGLTIMLAGVAMLVLPGPGILVILGGLALLATEFAWAKLTLKWAQKTMQDMAQKALDAARGQSASPPTDPPRSANSP